MDPLTYAAIAGIQMGLQAWQGEQQRQKQVKAQAAQGRRDIESQSLSQRQEASQGALGNLIAAYRSGLKK